MITIIDYGAGNIRSVQRACAEVGLEAVLVGNAAAALQGAPVTTLDFDFMFRKTAANLSKLKKLTGISSFSSLRSRARQVAFGRGRLWGARLEDIIASKRKLGRPRDKAVLDVLEKTLDEEKKAKKQKRPS